eukprot:216691-Prymnesium_polylepis.1
MPWLGSTFLMLCFPLAEHMDFEVLCGLGWGCDHVCGRARQIGSAAAAHFVTHSAGGGGTGTPLDT